MHHRGCARHHTRVYSLLVLGLLLCTTRLVCASGAGEEPGAGVVELGALPPPMQRAGRASPVSSAAQAVSDYYYGSTGGSVSVEPAALPLKEPVSAVASLRDQQPSAAVVPSGAVSSDDGVTFKVGSGEGGELSLSSPSGWYRYSQTAPFSPGLSSNYYSGALQWEPLVVHFIWLAANGYTWPSGYKAATIQFVNDLQGASHEPQHGIFTTILLSDGALALQAANTGTSILMQQTATDAW
jgi:hypothetical protein